jgi:hypothetical protein
MTGHLVQLPPRSPLRRTMGTTLTTMTTATATATANPLKMISKHF